MRRRLTRQEVLQKIPRQACNTLLRQTSEIRLVLSDVVSSAGGIEEAVDGVFLVHCLRAGSEGFRRWNARDAIRTRLQQRFQCLIEGLPRIPGTSGTSGLLELALGFFD